MSDTKAQIAERERFQATIREALKGGNKSMKQLREYCQNVEGITLERFPSRVGHMAKQKQLFVIELAKRDDHGNLQKLYTLDGCQPQQEADKTPLLCEYWPLPIPKTNAKPVLIEIVDKYHTQGGLGCAVNGRTGTTLSDLSRFPSHENF